MHLRPLLALVSSLALLVAPASAPAQSTTPSRLRLDRAKYRPGDCLRLTLNDSDKNRDRDKVETVRAFVGSLYPVSLSSGDLETVTLVETGPNTGIFRTPECLPIFEGDGVLDNGVLEVHGGDVIAAVYYDPANPEDRRDLRELDISADTALISGGDAGRAVQVIIDERILPEGFASTPAVHPAEGERPLAMVIDPTGVPLVFGEDQVIYQPYDKNDLAAFTTERGALEVEQIDRFGPDGSDDGTIYRLLRVEPDPAAETDLAYLMVLAGMEGQYIFSSKRAARLVALILEEQIGGRFMMHNPLAWFLERPVTREEPEPGSPPADPAFRDGFNFFHIRDQAIMVREAILHLDFTDRNQAASVPVAVIDGGFAGPGDFPSGTSHPDWGAPGFTRMSQGDCGLPNCAGSASGAMPLPCAGGPGSGCRWHGTASFSIIGAVANNRSGAMGIAGHGREPGGSDGVRSLIRPILLSVRFPYMTTLARAVNTARARGARVINISSGFACKPLLGIDLCDGGQRTLVNIACRAAATVLAKAVPGIGALIAELVSTSSCSALLAVMHLIGYQDADALSTALSRAGAAGIVVVASGPEDITIPGLGRFGPFNAEEVRMIPCVHPDVICAGAVDATYAPLAINPFGAGVDIWAPGGLIETMPNPETPAGQLDSFNGTSAAAPFVSGVVALMKAVNPAATPAQVRDILQQTSFPLASPPRDGCVTLSDGSCVGIVNAYEAVLAADWHPPLSCGPWEDREWTGASHAFYALVPPLDGTPGSEWQPPRPQSIHALPEDEDWYLFGPPPVMGSDATVMELTLEVDDPRDGVLQFELYEALGTGTPGALLARGSGPPSRLRIGPSMLFARAEYLVRVFAESNPGVNDNCYLLTLRVVRAGASADRYEENDTAAAARSPQEEWIHEEFHDPAIFEHEAPTPAKGGPRLVSQERWRLSIRDLSLHDGRDRDFFRIRIPDPADPADGGYPDIDPDPIVEPMPECATLKRRGIPPQNEDTIELRATLEVVARTTGGAVGEALRVNGATFSGGSGSILCPRDGEGLLDLLVSFGERPDARLSAVTYELELFYTISIVRTLNGRPEFPNLRAFPCGNSAFPCGPLVDRRVEMVLDHPSGPADPRCFIDGCPEPWFFEWREPGPFDAIFESSADLRFDLFTADGRRLGGAGSGLPPGGGAEGGGAGVPASRRLVIPDLPAGGYVLVVSGEPSRWSMRILPPDGGQDEPRFIRGDCNGDGQVTGQVTDAVFLLNFNFLGGAEPPCLAACDANGDGRVIGQVTDAVFLLNFNFLGGPRPPAPFPACGPGNPLDALLGCTGRPAGCR
jgi:subtilisin family serine protease